MYMNFIIIPQSIFQYNISMKPMDHMIPDVYKLKYVLLNDILVICACNRSMVLI